MDKIYVGDIPSDYVYARFNNNYIDLFNSPSINPNTNYDYFRIYLYNNMFAYEHNFGTTGYTGLSISNIVETTDNIMYRRDMPNILVMTTIFVLCFTFLINLVTSFVKKGAY